LELWLIKNNNLQIFYYQDKDWTTVSFIKRVSIESIE
jgi:hypothetical protein